MSLYRDIDTVVTKDGRAVLATVIAASGSTPAPLFSRMLIAAGGASTRGTIGGGCMEGEVITYASAHFHDPSSRVMEFTLTEDEVEQGLICGGNLEVLLEPLTPSDLPVFRELEEHLRNGADVVLCRFIGTDGTVRKRWLALQDASIPGGLAALIPDAAGKVLHSHIRQETQRIPVAEGVCFLEPVQGTPLLMIFGGGHVSRSIASVAATAGFRVGVYDDRASYANPARFPQAETAAAIDYEQAFAGMSVSRSTYIVIVTRGHRYDETVLEQALQTPARYIGMIGSRRKVITTYNHLRTKGFRETDIARVHAPVGVNIGALTAEEIGVSIVAQLIAVRRGMNPPYDVKSRGVADLGTTGDHC